MKVSQERLASLINWILDNKETIMDLDDVVMLGTGGHPEYIVFRNPKDQREKRGVYHSYMCVANHKIMFV